jgi:hypothetical protein
MYRFSAELVDFVAVESVVALIILGSYISAELCYSASGARAINQHEKNCFPVGIEQH